MVLPPGFHSEKPKQVCKLLRSLYGLKQASRQWNFKLTKALLENGYHQSTADPSLFTKASGTSFTASLIYVDDILVTGTDPEDIKALKTFLDVSFKIKDLGSLHYFLGIEAFNSNDGVSLFQMKYTLDILKEYGFLESKPASSPATPGSKLNKTEGSLIANPEEYRRLIGKLLYLTNTRPDISHAVQQLSQFVDKPRDTNLIAAHRVLRYLKKSPGKGLFYHKNSQLKLQGFSDSDWANCSDTRKSITGYCVYLGPNLISWRTKKQVTVSKSSSEAEYRALASTVCEIQWLYYLLTDLQVNFDDPATLFCDNRSAIAIGENHVFHERTKHIEIDCHIVKQKVNEGLVKLLPIPSRQQVADGFTKALSTPAFDIFQLKLGLRDIHAPAYGGVMKDRCDTAMSNEKG
ncbi:PREDICTED: uncharacterized protein LOC109156725 [Ipomoea nil]|uniref:uncharacterized protein LOC109156725 n=1 Tax=Ipomoea nil TaxID=35883 RepID=UPI00090089F5|nr:PREDICTED: uncharacterized protein LOC109156725 [Ipomoea nil]